MKTFVITLTLVLSLAIAPAPALAQTDTGPTPGSFWYGITTTFENVNLFFTFNNEKKAEKALTYAERRLTQAKAAAENENTGATEIALADYEEKLTLATESSKKIDNDERSEKLLTSIADNTTKHQEVLSEVLEKVPEEARKAIAKAIEASKRGQEEATQKIAELKGEVERLKQEVAELKQDNNNEQTAEIKKLKQEVEELKKKPATIQPVVTPAPTTPTQKKENIQSQITPKTETPKTTTVTLPNGAVVEMDASGNIVRTIKNAPEQTPYQQTDSAQERYYAELLRQKEEQQRAETKRIEQENKYIELCLDIRNSYTQKLIEAGKSGYTRAFAAGETARVQREMISALSAAGCEIGSTPTYTLPQSNYTQCTYGGGVITCY